MIHVSRFTRVVLRYFFDEFFPEASARVRYCTNDDLFCLPYIAPDRDLCQMTSNSFTLWSRSSAWEN
jgi:hypothetical protein